MSIYLIQITIHTKTLKYLKYLKKYPIIFKYNLNSVIKIVYLFKSCILFGFFIYILKFMIVFCTKIHLIFIYLKVESVRIKYFYEKIANIAKNY